MALFLRTATAASDHGRFLRKLGLLLIVLTLTPLLLRDVLQGRSTGTKDVLSTSHSSGVPVSIRVKKPSIMNYIRSDLQLSKLRVGEAMEEVDDPEDEMLQQSSISPSNVFSQELEEDPSENTAQEDTDEPGQLRQSLHEGGDLGSNPVQDQAAGPSPSVLQTLMELPTKLLEQVPEVVADSTRTNISNFTASGLSLEDTETDKPSGTLRWTTDAELYIEDRLNKIQHPTDCSKSKWLVVDSDVSGLMWNFNAAVRALVVGLQTNRTVVFQGLKVDPEKPWNTAAWDGCTDRTISCYFKVTGCDLQDQPAESPGLGKLSEWPFWNSTLLEELAHVQVVRSGALRSWPGKWEEIAPAGLWNDLVATGALHMEDGGDPTKSASVQRVFMLFSIIAKWMTKPVPKIEKIANQIMAQYADVETPIVSLHIRRADKLKEDPYWVEHKRYRDPSEYGSIISELESKRGYQWPTVFVECDSEELLQRIVRDPASFGLRASTRVIHNSLLNRSAIEEYHGHDHVPPELKAELQEHFVATLYVMAQLSDYVVATLTSHVGRHTWEYMGAKKGLEQVGVQGELGYSLDQPIGSWYRGQGWYP